MFKHCHYLFASMRIFQEFNSNPLTSASIAQVHAARTHDGRKVAVKVQHSHLTDTAVTDIATVGLIVNVLHWCLPAFDYRKEKVTIDTVDHGLYKELDFATRTNYVALWKLGAGEDLSELFAAVLTMRPWNGVIDPSVDNLVLKGNDSDRSEIQMYASQYFSQILELFRRLQRAILLMLRTNDCLRAVTRALEYMHYRQIKQARTYTMIIHAPTGSDFNS